MTIRKGEEWGRTVPRPDDLRLVDSDERLVEALTDGSKVPVAPTAGDLHRTLGARDATGEQDMLELPLDLLRVTLDDDVRFTACAHVLLQRRAVAGGWWRGDVVMVMNAEFVGDWHVVARGHPNDGRAESCTWGSDFGVRQRWAARRRLPAGGHVPHPLIETRSFRDRAWSFDAPMEVRIDGVRVGRTRSLDVMVDADAAVLYA